jgi:hypothetical protein
MMLRPLESDGRLNSRQDNAAVCVMRGQNDVMSRSGKASLVRAVHGFSGPIGKGGGLRTSD